MTAVDVGGLGFFLNLTAEELQNDFGLEPTKSSDFFQQMDTVLRDAEPERAAAVSDFAASEDADAKSRPKAKHKKNEIDLELDLEDYDEHEHDAQGKNNETEQNFNAGTHLPDHRDPYKAEQEQIRYDAIHKVGGVRDAIRRLRLRQVQGRAEKVQKKSADAAVAGASEDSHLKQDEDILILEGHVRPLDHADRSSNDLAPTRAVRPNDRRERTSRTRSESKATADAPHLTEASVTNMEGSQVENVERGDIPGAVLMPISGKGGTAAARPSAAPSSTSSPPSAPPVMKKLSHFQEVELFKEMAKKGGVAAATSTKTKSSLSSGSFQDVVEEDKIYEQSSGKRVRAQFDGARVSKSSKKRRQDNGTDDRQENSDGKSLKFKFHHPLLERVCDGRAREQSLKDITLDRVHAGKEVELEMVGMWRSLKKEAKAAAAYEDYVFALSDLKNPQ
ncbi:unnamed protein product [Amoebophrya sp. A120]|nr:unnamed protein product [Amoebophrya sp. A120]|eukprot:GSA120T00004267001.1